MPKRPCTQRAEWRLQPGKPAERLSEHYQLDCDYGTALITIYKESDSIEPIYLCEGHVTEVGRPVKNAVVRGPAAEPTETRKRTKGGRAKGDPAKGDRPKAEDRIRPAEVAATKPNGSAPPDPAEVKASPATAKSDSAVPSEAKASPATAKPGRSTKDPLVKAPVRDLTYGSSAKALVDEAIWNLASGDGEIYRTLLRQGKPAIEAANAAGGQLAIVHRKIGEYTLTIEALLSESTARISAAEAINKPLEQATLEIIGNSAMGDTEKDAAVEHLGALQESLNRGLNRELTALQAHRVACAVGDRANWGASSDLSEELKPAYRAVYSNARNALVAAVPDALSVLERLANLYVAKAELEDAPQLKLSHHADSVSLTT